MTLWLTAEEARLLATARVARNDAEAEGWASSALIVDVPDRTLESIRTAAQQGRGALIDAGDVRRIALGGRAS